MKVGDIVRGKDIWSARPIAMSGDIGVVLGFDPEARAVLCLIGGDQLWYRKDQLEIINESR